MTISPANISVIDKSIFAGSQSILCPSGIVNSYQACAVGGNSAINAGLYFEPPASDWDDYHPAGWKSADVRGATERLLAKQPSVTNYSQDGKFYLQSGYEAAEAWIHGAAGFANVTINDVADNKDRVFGRPAYNYIHGQRGGPTETYLQEALRRENFRLETGVRVRRIKQVAGVASGVQATVGDREVNVALAPGGRVVVSTGAIASPGLLMHSGIGPRETLANLSTSLTDSLGWVVNNAVGEGLFDNPNTFLVLSDPSIESYAQNYDNPVPADRDLYLKERSGPYSFASQTSVFWGYVPNPDGTRTGVQGTIDVS